MNERSGHPANAKKWITILLANNSNQHLWLRAVRSYARENHCTQFLLNQYNVSRALTATDLNPDKVLKPVIKGEPSMPGLEKGLKQDGQPSSSSSSSSSGSSRPADDLFNNLDELDDHEAKMFEGFEIFLNLDGTEESSGTTALRFQFSNIMTTSLVNHKHRLHNWKEGNITQLIQLVTTEVRLTSRAKYNSLMNLGKVDFPSTKSVDQLVSDLSAVQIATNRLKPGAIDEEILKGALLTLTSRRPMFHLMSQTFSRTDCQLSYDQMVSEFRNTQDNHDSLAKPATQPVFQLKTAPSVEDSTRIDISNPDTLEQIFALFKTLNKGKKTPADQSKEVCNNFLQGKCTYGDKCRRIHPPGKGGSMMICILSSGSGTCKAFCALDTFPLVL